MSRHAPLVRAAVLALVLFVALHWCLDGWLQSIQDRLGLYQSMINARP
jgi:hypothetical protein